MKHFKELISSGSLHQTTINNLKTYIDDLMKSTVVKININVPNVLPNLLIYEAL